MHDRPANPGKDHILILGASKTGTTGLYSSIKGGLRAAGINAYTMFEPSRFDLVENLFRLAPGEPVMVKLTFDAVAGALPDPLVYDRRVMTVRDPRDVLISSLLFRPLTKRAIERSDAGKTDEFIAALERKEADPSAVSVRELFDLTSELGLGHPPYSRMVRYLHAQLQLIETVGFHIVQYKRFVAGDLADLSAYLGFPVEVVSNDESSVFGHISRSKDPGAFQRWFREDDLAYFNDMFREFLPTLGYDIEAKLDAAPVIDPATSSDYVRTRSQSRRENLLSAASGRARAWEPTDVDSAELETLTHFADDGDATACLRVAQVALSGHLGGRDEATALRWARASAQHGLSAGMRLTLELLDDLHSDDPAVHREIRTWQVELAFRNPVALANATKQVASLEAELATLRSSSSMRIGSQLAALADNPRKKGPKAMRELIRIWRGRNKR